MMMLKLTIFSANQKFLFHLSPIPLVVTLQHLVGLQYIFKQLQPNPSLLMKCTTEMSSYTF